MSPNRKFAASSRASEAIGPAATPHAGTLVPSDVRLANVTRILAELRGHAYLSRSDLARRTGLAVPTVHRLVSELVALDLVIEDAPAADESRLGRPPVVYRFRREAGFLAGFDVGNQTTRAAVASLAGEVLTSRTVSTSDIEDDLAGGIADLVLKLLTEVDASPQRLAGVGVGIAAVVDPETGVLRQPPQHLQWHAVALGAQLRERLGCAAVVDQDDHLAAVAECSSVGTAPGARSIVVLAIGKGIGFGAALESVPLLGHAGRFGRIASWPVTAPRGVRLPGRTLEECLPAEGLVAQYHQRGGQGPVTDGLSLFTAARNGDAVARAVVTWVARELADVVHRLRVVFDPEAFVLGGGISRGFDLLEPELARHTNGIEPVVRPSVLDEVAVLTGALLTAQTCVEPWLHAQLVHA
jgi:predicted NBD/HSP70 family sugar kinase